MLKFNRLLSALQILSDLDKNLCKALSCSSVKLKEFFFQIKPSRLRLRNLNFSEKNVRDHNKVKHSLI